MCWVSVFYVFYVVCGGWVCSVDVLGACSVDVLGVCSVDVLGVFSVDVFGVCFSVWPLDV